MGSKKLQRVIDKASAEQEEMSKRLAAVRGQLTAAEEKLVKAKDRAMRWKQEAKAQQMVADQAGAQIEKLQRKLDEATAALKSVQSAAGRGTASASPAAAESAEKVPAPDESWTVAQLRAEARARGITGMSNKPKAQLLAALK